jgi:hypothetical protein
MGLRRRRSEKCARIEVTGREKIMDHSKHEIVIVAEEVTVEFAVRITGDGDVETTPESSPAITGWDNSTSSVYCKTCGTGIREGEGGLAEDWQFLS